MESGQVRMKRLKRENAAFLQTLGSALEPELLHARVPRLATAAEGRQELKNVIDTMSTLGTYCRKNGFDPTRTFQHVANVDQAVWSVILELFAKHNEETGELEDDGLLYKTDPTDGTLKLNRPFFYMLLDYLESSGYTCDMRNKIKLT